VARAIEIGGTSRRHPSHTTGHMGPYHGGSIELSWGRNIELGETEGIEIGVAKVLSLSRCAARGPRAVTAPRSPPRPWPDARSRPTTGLQLPYSSPSSVGSCSMSFASGIRSLALIRSTKATAPAILSSGVIARMRCSSVPL
jgi:hypothetical protein